MKISKEWQKAFDKLESTSTFDLLYLDQVESGEMTCREVWDANIQWLNDLVSDCTSIQTPWDEDDE